MRRISWHTSGTLFLLALSGGACGPGSEDGPGETFTVRDSAGVSIWEHTDFPSGGVEEWRAADAPSLVLGEESGEEALLFARIRGVVPTPNGGVAVADGQSREVRFFDADGTPLLTAGGEGEGPGEFTFLGDLFPYRGDSLAATDAFARTITIFGPTGAWGRTLRLHPDSAGLTGTFVDAAFPDGSFLVRGMQQFATEGPTLGYHRDVFSFQIFGAEGGPGPILLELPGGEVETLDREGRLMSFPLIMGRGEASAMVGGDVFVGVTDRLDLRRYAPDGTLRGILRVGIPPTPMDDEIRDRWIEYALQDVEDEDQARSTRQRFRERSWPDSLPVFSEILGDSEGNLWVRRFSPEFVEGPSIWWVFGPDGSYRARAELPGGLTVEAISPDFVLGIASDEYGVERVYRYRLEKG